MIIPQYIKDWHDYVKAEPEKHCKAIKDLVKLINNLLKRKDIAYDSSDVKAFEEFCLLLKHKEGQWAGQPFELSIEQKYIVACVLGLKIKNERGRWVRYFREMILIVARGWGKSLFASALALYMLCADQEPGAQVWTLATDKTQAEIVYQNAVDFADCPELRDHLKQHKDSSGHRFVYAANKSFMKAGSKNLENKDGLNPHAVVIDELHKIKDRYHYDVMSSAQQKREQPLIIIISSNGLDRECIFDQKYDQAKLILKGKANLRIFPMIFEIDENDDPENEACWVKANPGMPVRPTLTDLRIEFEKTKSDPSLYPSFLAKNLNRASNSSVVYFDLQAINKCAIDMTPDLYTDKYAVGGVDLSETTDLCCASALIPQKGKLYLVQKYFIAEERIDLNSKLDKMAYRSFCNTQALDPLNNELLKICDGSLVKRNDITEWFCELRDKYQLTFWKIGADSWHFGDFSEDMANNGFSIEDSNGRGITFSIIQGPKTLSQPMKETKVLFNDQVIQFSKYNGLFRWCCDNTRATTQDSNNNIKPDKVKSKRRIDGYSSFLHAYIAYQKCKDLFDEYQP